MFWICNTCCAEILAGIIRAIGDSKTPLYFLIISTVINVFLDCSFIAGLGWGVFGAAFATVCSQLISGILCLILVIPKIGFIGACIASPLAWILADMFLFPAYFHVMKKLEVMMASRKIAH